MYRELHIENFKSIVDVKIPLGRVNVFIGPNGSGKSNILEAVAMMSAAKSLQLTPQALVNKGVRVAKPNLTINSFSGIKPKRGINISLSDEGGLPVVSKLNSKEKDNIYAAWYDEVDINAYKEIQTIFKEITPKQLLQAGATAVGKRMSAKELKSSLSNKRQIDSYFKVINQSLFVEEQKRRYSKFAQFLIYNLQTNVLRGISSGESYARPLGIYGEGLDVLLSTFKAPQLRLLKRYDFIDWMKSFTIDDYDSLKFKGHKLGRSKSRLYLRDKYMNRTNNILSAENANEGALHALFYLALLISDITPSFFAIDNIENTLNPRLCENLIKAIAELSQKNNKQVLITTHSPSLLDGINLNDDEQRLFIVKRNFKGHTIVERVQSKPSEDKKYRLSQLFIEDYLGGLNPLM